MLTQPVLTGPMIGGVLPNQATVWGRYTGQSVAVRYQAQGDSAWTSLPPVTMDPNADYTFSIPLTGLKPVTTYLYQLTLNGTLSPTVYSFRTTIVDNNVLTPVSFAVLSDFKDAFAPTLARAVNADAGFAPDFVLMIGDLDHSGPGLAPDGGILDDAEALAPMREMRLRLRTPAQSWGGTNFGTDFNAAFTLRNPQVPVYNVWDDHDYCFNNADRTCPSKDAGLEVVSEYFVPGRLDVPPNQRTGGWQRIRVGKHVEVFMLDARSNRDPPGDAGSQESMLGSDQLAWLQKVLPASTADWKFVVSPVPFNNTTKSWDSWAAGAQPVPPGGTLPTLNFQDERKTLAALFHDNHVLVISGDIHSGGAIDTGDAGDTPEVSVPHANMAGFVNTYLQKGSPAPDSPHWDIGRDTPNSPDFGWPLDGCLGGNCDGGSDPGFVYVTVTPSADGSTSTMLMTVRDQNGVVKTTPYAHKPLKLCWNGPCGGMQP